MQAENENRRATGVRRVGLSTLVEICGRAPGVPAFEAESVEVSGRGMQVRTKFLPALSAPLVLRFDHDGREAVIEGEVAWRRETDHGGEFGIKFTALDSNSVGVLKQLCTPAKAAEQRVIVQPEPADEAGLEARRGAAVKLHIGGLGAPMKARVFDGGPRKLSVGSQLEFLKVGRTLELEDVSLGARRGANIESVSIAIDPETRIPQLVVSLRYEGEEVTPEPTIVDARGREQGQRASASADRAGAWDTSAEAQVDAELEEIDEDEAVEAAEELFRSRVESLIASASGVLKSSTATVRVATASVAGGINALIDGTRKGSAKRAAGPRATRATSPAVGSGQRDANRRLRPQHQSNHAAVSGPLKNPKLMATIAGAVGVFLSGTYVLFSDDSPEATSPAQVQPQLQAQVQPQTAAVAVAAVPAPVVLAPGQFPPPATLDTDEQANVVTGAIVAQVPLFGATPMATVEAAPTMPLEQQQIDEYSLAKDEAFADKIAPAEEPLPEPASSQGQTQWQVGRMHLPVIHRLRLDAPGTALQAEKTATGFTVVVPGRQVKENGALIAKLDDRIAQVHVKNTPAGAKVMFRFQGEIPGYKVRLRNDFIEFFVNAPLKKK